MPTQEKSEKPKIDNKKLIAMFLALIVLILAIIWFFKVSNKNKIDLEVYIPSPQASMETGETGMLKEGETIKSVNPEAYNNPVRPLDQPVPHDIFHTAGTIIAIQANSIVLRGNGTNFDDQAKRNLVVVIDKETKVNGVKGDLEYFKKSLKTGDRISIEAPYNIHGKTEFLARYINKIK